MGQRPLHAVVGGSNGTQSLFVCRGGDELSFPGQLSWDGCFTVVGGGTIQLFHRYQVLVNEEGSARLEWMNWQQFTALPQAGFSVILVGFALPMLFFSYPFFWHLIGLAP